jgi:hypothetical protein
MRWFMVPALLWAATRAEADTLILKDGRTIEWRSIKDDGESLLVETTKGSMLSLKKSDVEKVVFTPPQAPLTGAVFVFDTKKRRLDTIDLLSKADPVKAVGGSWKVSSGSLVGSAAEGHSRLPLGFGPPKEEYDIHMTLSRKEGTEDFFVGLVAPNGRQFTYHLDAFKSSWSGPMVVDGKENPLAGDTGVPGCLFKNGQPRSVTIMIRKRGLAVRMDNKDHHVLNVDDWGRFSLYGNLAVPDKNVIFMGCVNSTWQVSKCVLSVPKD